jgi:hypothetical protein
MNKQCCLCDFICSLSYFILEVSGFEPSDELEESLQVRGNITIGTRLPHHVRSIRVPADV